MMPIARRILESRNDARMAGHRPVKARISPQDMLELDAWLRQQNRANLTGLPTQSLSKDNLWGMKVVSDEKVRNIIILEMEKQHVAR